MSDNSKQSKKEEFFGRALYDVEHALGMYALSYCTIPAGGIYDKEALEPLMSVIESCHIYLIGYTPIIDFVGADQIDSKLNLKFTITGREHIVSYDLPSGVTLKKDGELHYLEDESGQRFWPNENDMKLRLSHESNEVNFDIKYIG